MPAFVAGCRLCSGIQVTAMDHCRMDERRTATLTWTFKGFMVRIIPVEPAVLKTRVRGKKRWIKGCPC